MPLALPDADDQAEHSAIVDQFREYLNTHGVIYDTFDYESLKPFLQQNTILANWCEFSVSDKISKNNHNRPGGDFLCF